MKSILISLFLISLTAFSRGAPELSLGDAFCFEGDFANIPVHLSEPLNEDLTITYETRTLSGSTWRSSSSWNRDYLRIPKATLIIPAGETQSMIVAETFPRPDTVAAKVFAIAVTDTTPSITLAKPQSIVTIRDSDRTDSWSVPTMAGKVRWWGSANGDGVFLLVGDSGTIASSTDGRSWSIEATGVTDRLHAANWDGRQFVVVGAKGRILTSPDGKKWKREDSPVERTLRSVTWTGERLIAVGYGGLILISEKGVHWKDEDSNTELDLLDVFWTGSEAIIVGKESVLLRGVPGNFQKGEAKSLFPPEFAGRSLTLNAVTTHRDDLYIGTTSGVMKSTDQGRSWILQVPDEAPDRFTAYDVVDMGDLGLLAIGRSGDLCLQTFGGGWTALENLTSQRLYTATWTGTRLLVAGTKGAATVLHFHDDPSVTVHQQNPNEFTTVENKVAEESKRTRFELRLSQPVSEPLRVGVRTREERYGGSLERATPGQDYHPIDRTLTFQPGQTSVSVEIEIIDDTLVERLERFDVYFYPKDQESPARIKFEDQVKVVTISSEDAHPFSEEMNSPYSSLFVTLPTILPELPMDQVGPFNFFRSLVMGRDNLLVVGDKRLDILEDCRFIRFIPIDPGVSRQPSFNHSLPEVIWTGTEYLFIQRHLHHAPDT
ncbi:MAG: Calx-beta domain-containing protein, partial [Verrucomicrobiota bacterium]